MGKNNPTQGLLRIGELADICGVTRKAVLFYEKAGLLEPSYINPESGYRYYGAEALTELMKIIRFRDAGMSISEICDYMKNGSSAAQTALHNMEERMNALWLSMETVRSLSVAVGDYTVTLRSHPAQRCFARSYVCHSVDEAMSRIFDTIFEVASLGISMRQSYGMFAEYDYDFLSGETLDLDNFTVRICIPVPAETQHEACVDFPAIYAATVHHRGDYNDIGRAYEALGAYVQERKLSPIAPVREYYIDGGRGFDETAERFVTKLMLPIASIDRMRLPLE